MSMQKRVEAAFGAQAAANVSPWDYLGLLIENNKNIGSEARRVLTRMLLIVGIFELLTRAAIGEVSALGFKVSDLTLIHKFLPTIAAFSAYEFLNLLRASSRFDAIYSQIMETCYPNISNANLHHALSPREIAFLEYIPEKVPVPARKWRTATTVIEIILVLVVLLLPAAILIYFITRSMQYFTWPDPVMVSSAAIATLLTIAGYLGLVAEEASLAAEEASLAADS